jgi:hypothetical protein
VAAKTRTLECGGSISPFDHQQYAVLRKCLLLLSLVSAAHISGVVEGRFSQADSAMSSGKIIRALTPTCSR